jgi:hypothetical protein
MLATQLHAAYGCHCYIGSGVSGSHEDQDKGQCR